ncbi:MAG: class F sortase, partial [Actinomycetota bacterium]
SIDTVPTASDRAADDATDDAAAKRALDDQAPAPDAAAPPTTIGPDGEVIELSPLAALLGPRYSTIPEEIEPRPRPVGVTTDRIDIDDFPIRDVGLEDDGQLEVPDETEIGWYRYGATAGRPGATVLAAHVSWNRTTGPFFQLGTMEPGDIVTVALDDGTARTYEVTERTMYDKDELPRDRIWRNTGPETLVLITCGGDFNPEIRRYRQNIVVYAVPVA